MIRRPEVGSSDTRRRRITRVSVSPSISAGIDFFDKSTRRRREAGVNPARPPPLLPGTKPAHGHWVADRDAVAAPGKVPGVGGSGSQETCRRVTAFEPLGWRDRRSSRFAESHPAGRSASQPERCASWPSLAPPRDLRWEGPRSLAPSQRSRVFVRRSRPGDAGPRPAPGRPPSIGEFTVTDTRLSRRARRSPAGAGPRHRHRPRGDRALGRPHAPGPADARGRRRGLRPDRQRRPEELRPARFRRRPGTRVFLDGAPLNEPRNNGLSLELIPLPGTRSHRDHARLDRGARRRRLGGGRDQLVDAPVSSRAARSRRRPATSRPEGRGSVWHDFGCVDFFLLGRAGRRPRLPRQRRRRSRRLQGSFGWDLGPSAGSRSRCSARAD